MSLQLFEDIPMCSVSIQSMSLLKLGQCRRKQRIDTLKVSVTSTYSQHQQSFYFRG